jgi:hypothetical protein
MVSLGMALSLNRWLYNLGFENWREPQPFGHFWPKGWHRRISGRQVSDLNETLNSPAWEALDHPGRISYTGNKWTGVVEEVE